ncbi:MAG: hypothetical protein M9928_18870 [Anaerolineae bacterium]|nr:hypothetical protein [Anaerolineae bacterium]MCO5207077.1 hypothetical protein [Anaerolineae bacterium]
MNAKQEMESRYMGLGTALGMAGGGLIGFAVWMATGLFIFLPVFIGAGLPVGYAIGQKLTERHSAEYSDKEQ